MIVAHVRIALLMDNRRDENWGSQATTTALVRLLQDAYPGAEIVGVSRSATRPRNGLTRRLVERLAPQVALRDAWGSAAGRWCAQQLVGSWLPTVRGADLIVVNGEGTLHSQKQTLRWLPALACVADFAAAPLWIVNTTIEVEIPSHRPLFSRVLQKADRLVVREPYSYDVAKSLGAAPIAGADCALLADGAEDAEVDSLLQSIGVGPEFAVMTGSAVVERWNPDAQAAIAREVLGAGLDVVYVASTGEDRRNHSRAFASLRVPMLTNDDVGYRAIVGLIRRAKIFVGGRFHLIIFAAKAGTPFVAVPSNTHKTVGLLRLLSAEDRLFEMADGGGQLKCVRSTLASGCSRASEVQRRAERLAAFASRNASAEEGERAKAYPALSLA
jgi:polysaccharide pyruvyl transferase WcaK-like protein